MPPSPNTVGDAVAGYFTGFKSELEMLFVVRPAETWSRIRCHLDPRLYSERLRLRRVSEGAIAKKGDRFILFVIYARHEVPSFIQTVIDAIGRSRLNLVISTNARISEELRATLLEKCHLLIERADLGRDFGGYKDGISVIERRYGTPERLILLNDSLFFLERGLDSLIAGLDDDDDLIAMTEDFHLYYHLQSFALSFSRRVLQHRRIRKYWRKYRPVSTRYWAIQQGERLLTYRLQRAGFTPKILYPAAKLIPSMRQAKVADLFEAIYFLPQAMRDRFFRELDELRESQTAATLAALDTMSRSVQRLHKIGPDGVEFLRSSNIEKLLQVNHQIATVHRTREEWAVETFGERIAMAIADANQIHTGGFLFMKYLGMPAFKRDLFYREVYGLEEVDEILSMLDVPLKKEIMGEMRQKGTATLMYGFRKILYRHGAI